MTLDLYYSNFTNVGDSLEKMYKSFLLDNQKVILKVSTENTAKAKASENGRVQPTSLEKTSMTTKLEGRRPFTTLPQKLKIQIRKPESLRNGQTTPTRNPAGSPLKTSPPQRNVPSCVPLSPKKMSPQELRGKKSAPTKNVSNHTASRTEHDIERIDNSKPQNIYSTNSDLEPSSSTDLTDDNILRQQNSRSSHSPSSVAALPTKCKVNNKVYFREENVENLTWNGEPSYIEDPEGDPDASTSPKVNPYSSSFLNFLSSN